MGSIFIGILLVALVSTFADEVCRAQDGSDCLPEGWGRAEDEHGQEFFHHLETGMTQWERPTKPLITGKQSLEMYLEELSSLASKAPLNVSEAERLKLLGGVKALSTMKQDTLPTPQNMEWNVLSSGTGGTPRIYMLDEFLSAEECEYLIAISQSRLSPAGVVQSSGNKFTSSMQTRNNEQVWLSPKEESSDPVVQHIVKRLHRSAHIPEGDAEVPQVGRYRSGTKYEMHGDSTPEQGVARPATIIVYLSDVEAGGETIFPITEKNIQRCSEGWHKDRYGIANCCDVDSPAGGRGGLLRILPKRGRAVLFYSHDLKGNELVSAKHAACPPKNGTEKWIMQRWFRLEPHSGAVQPRDVRFDGLPVPKPEVAEGVWTGRHDARVLNQKAPAIYYFEDFLSDVEQQHLRSLAEGSGLLRGGTAGTVKRHRLAHEVEAEDALVSSIVKRMHIFARVPEGHADPLQFVSYGASGSREIRGDSSKEKKRPMTLIVFLDGDGKVQDGGAHIFPMGACKGSKSLSDCCVDAMGRVQTFEFKLDGKKKISQLGLKLGGNDGGFLAVKSIKPGLVQEWNLAHPEKQFTAGTRIIQVDGVRGSTQALLAALKSARDVVTLQVEMSPSSARAGGLQPILVPPKAGSALLVLSHFPDGSLDSQAVYGSCPAGPKGKLLVQRHFRFDSNPSLKQA